MPIDVAQSLYSHAAIRVPGPLSVPFVFDTALCLGGKTTLRRSVGGLAVVGANATAEVEPNVIDFD